uniref:FAR1 domain-containing protein n=1 Tax=Chenopodium quinoa TaxID=63459 RepID=A0A803LR97_CHEQI
MADSNDEVENWVPRVGMEFDSVEDAWNFWLQYGGKMGFNVRKHYENRSKDGQVTSRRFVCSKEGFRQPDKRDHLTTNSRAERRTGCKVRIGIILIRFTWKYQVHDFVSEHNHVLHPPETSHLLPSQRKISEIQAIEIELADDSGIRPRAAHEFIGAHVGGSSNLGYTHRDHKNYLRNVLRAFKACMYDYKEEAEFEKAFEALRGKVTKVPEKYILKRWTKEARSEVVEDVSGRAILEDPWLDATRRYKSLCQKFVKVASRASNFEESSSLLENGLNNLISEVDKLFMSLAIEKGRASSDVNSSEQLQACVSNSITLKPKEGKKGGKRRKSWIEKFHDASTQASRSKQTIHNKKKVPNHPNSENIPPQGECYGSEASSYDNIWKEVSFQTQAMNVPNSSLELNP